MKTKKAKGFMLLPAVLMSILLGLLGLSFLQIFSGQFTAMSSGRKAIQALQFAQSEADYLRNVDYSSLSGHARQAISGANGWQSQVSIGSESVVGGVKQRMATVNVYRNNSINTPDFSLQVPLSSAGAGASEGGDNLPIGTILPYQGSVSDIPEKWHLCDGKNGTPDLTDGRFLEGSSTAKSWHSAGLPNIKGSIKRADGGFGFVITGTNAKTTGITDGALTTTNNDYFKVYGGDHYATRLRVSFNAHDSNPIYSDDITTVQPKSYTVMYIMKIKA